MSEYIKVPELYEEKVEETKNIRIEVSSTEPEAAMNTSEAPKPVQSHVKDIMCVKSMEYGVEKLLMLGRGCQNHRATKIQTTKPLPTHLIILQWENKAKTSM